MVLLGLFLDNQKLHSATFNYNSKFQLHSATFNYIICWLFAGAHPDDGIRDLHYRGGFVKSTNEPVWTHDHILLN